MKTQNTKSTIIRSELFVNQLPYIGEVTKKLIVKAYHLRCLYIIFVGALISHGVVHGQQELILTKFTFNSLYFNPAYAGSTGFNAGSLFVQYRKQWMGFDGAPETMMFGAEASFFRDRVGLGVSIAKEQLGIDSRYDISTNYAYRIMLADESMLALGVRLGFNTFRADFSKVDDQIVNPGTNVFDPIYTGSDSKNFFSPGIGVYWNSERAFLGFSLPVLGTVSFNGSEPEFRQRHFYGHAGMYLDLVDDDIRLEPSILLKYQKAVPIQATVGVNVWFMDFLGVGVNWRKDDALAFNVEIFAQEKFRLVAAYDFTISGLQDYNDGTLEVMMAYYFTTNEKERRSEAIRRGYKF